MMQWPYRIKAAAPNDDGHTVTLTWQDGTRTVTDMAPSIAAGGIFAPLADGEFFKRVSVASNGRAIEWPGEIDCCADALWFEAHPEDNPFADHPRAAAG